MYPRPISGRAFPQGSRQMRDDAPARSPVRGCRSSRAFSLARRLRPSPRTMYASRHVPQPSDASGCQAPDSVRPLQARSVVVAQVGSELHGTGQFPAHEATSLSLGPRSGSRNRTVALWTGGQIMSACGCGTPAYAGSARSRSPRRPWRSAHDDGDAGALRTSTPS